VSDELAGAKPLRAASALAPSPAGAEASGPRGREPEHREDARHIPRWRSPDGGSRPTLVALGSHTSGVPRRHRHTGRCLGADEGQPWSTRDRPPTSRLMSSSGEPPPFLDFIEKVLVPDSICCMNKIGKEHLVSRRLY
jgi:hypothetical protein